MKIKLPDLMVLYLLIYDIPMREQYIMSTYVIKILELYHHIVSVIVLISDNDIVI